MEEPLDEQRVSWLSRLREKLFGSAEEEDEGTTRFQLHSRGAHHVSVLYARSMEDARRAADGLKAGSQQVVNFQYTDSRTRERVVDFLMGVVYALEGTVERVHEQVFLFVPANVKVEAINTDDYPSEDKEFRPR